MKEEENNNNVEISLNENTTSMIGAGLQQPMNNNKA